jgi:aminoglycoside 6'-N-acetyltransferase
VGQLTLRALVEADAAELRRIHAAPEVARWWGPPEDGFPLDDDPDAARLTILVDGAVAGLIQYYEETHPRYRHASIDLFLDPALHGRGLGTEALRRLVARLVDERGHHRITIDPAASNATAIRSYAKVGFRPVGILRRYERDVDSDVWHDALLMELIAVAAGAASAGGSRTAPPAAAVGAGSVPALAAEVARLQREVDALRALVRPRS